jgi:hypothetical protein
VRPGIARSSPAGITIASAVWANSDAGTTRMASIASFFVVSIIIFQRPCWPQEKGHGLCRGGGTQSAENLIL